jgi:hypothetical protein
LYSRICSEIVEQYIVKPSEPQGGIGRFDLGNDVCLRYVGLRSQSLADPTLKYRALSGRRAVYKWHAAVRMAAKRCGKSFVFLAGSFRNCAAEPGASAKPRLRRRRAGLELGFRTGGWREDPAERKRALPLEVL